MLLFVSYLKGTIGHTFSIVAPYSSAWIPFVLLRNVGPIFPPHLESQFYFDVWRNLRKKILPISFIEFYFGGLRMAQVIFSLNPVLPYFVWLKKACTKINSARWCEFSFILIWLAEFDWPFETFLSSLPFIIACCWTIFLKAECFCLLLISKEGNWSCVQHFSALFLNMNPTCFAEECSVSAADESQFLRENHLVMWWIDIEKIYGSNWCGEV